MSSATGCARLPLGSPFRCCIGTTLIATPISTTWSRRRCLNYATYLTEIEVCRANRADLDATIVAPNGRDRFTFRWILIHLIEEYARHNGHADLIREAIDGETGE